MNTPHDQRHTSRFPLRLFVLPVLLTLSVGIALLSVFWYWSARNLSSVQARYVPVQKISGKPISVLRLSEPGTVPESDSVDALSTHLLQYLSTLGPNVGVEVYDLTHQHSYSYNSTEQFLTASSIKVPIMLTFFALSESQGREPNTQEMSLLTAMIEHSDNDAASALFDEIGGAAGIAAFLQRTGINGLLPNEDAWGYSRITPQAMVNLLTRLHDGTILTATDRATAFYLMQHVETDQQWGVGDTAPTGASFAMKNGWVPGPDGLWSVNTSGIVNVGGETYIISVYTQEQSSLADGQAIVQQVCGTVAGALV